MRPPTGFRSNIGGIVATELSVLEAIRTLLREHGVTFREVHHEPVRTSEQAAAAREEPLEIGGKAIVAKVGEGFHLLVFSAARRLDSKAVRKHLGARRFRFATAEELAELTGLVPGSVPPFGRPILPLDLYVDTSILGNERIAFNAGSLTDSIVLDRERYLEVARPTDVFSFTRP
jgi:prolyl-tRNA editing enzyme YbaK/EbsC (Cys-tRNA(Pro) deacylase)